MNERPRRTPAAIQRPGEAAAIHANTGTGSPFGPEFQGMLLRLLLEDQRFAHGVRKDLDATFFSYAPFSWAWRAAQQYSEAYTALPSFSWLLDHAMRTCGQQGPLFAQALHTSRSTPVQDEQWLRDKTLDWIRRNIFRKAYGEVKSIFDSGDADAAYDWMQQAIEKVRAVDWANPDRSFFAEEFIDRQVMRTEDAMRGGLRIPTGIGALDKLLDGGPDRGFLGVWIAYPKAGKTTTLINLGHTAFRLCRRPTLHFVFEGSRQMVEARYDTLMLDELYVNVKRGDVDAEKYSRAVAEMKELRRMLVIRAFTDQWDASITHIDQELRDLKSGFGFRPDAIIVDYADLVKPRKAYDSDYAEQRAVFQDLKVLAKRTESVMWTASQVTRPKDKDFDTIEALLKSKDIADSYAKVRIADFIGSINQTVAEREAQRMRLYAELYRDGAAHLVIPVQMDFAKMGMADGGAATSPTLAAPAAAAGTHGMSKTLGYVPIQSKNGV